MSSRTRNTRKYGGKSFQSRNVWREVRDEQRKQKQELQTEQDAQTQLQIVEDERLTVRGTVDNSQENRDAPGSVASHPQVSTENIPPPELVDCNGEFKPPPVDWDARIRYSDRNQKHSCNKWAERVAAETFDEKVSVAETTVSFDNPLLGPGNIIAPENWIPDTIDGSEREHWWRVHSQQNLDLEVGWPWWQRFAFPTANFLTEMVHPRSDRNPQSSVARKPKTAQEAIEIFQRKKLPARRHTRQLLSNVHYRMAEMGDMVQLSDIWNYYIQKPRVCFERAPLATAQVQQRWEAVKTARLPFLVAEITPSKGNKSCEKTDANEIIGFIFAEPVKEVEFGTFRSTARAQVFVKSDFTRHKIGSTLLERLTHAVSHACQPACQNDPICEESRNFEKIRYVIFEIPADERRLEWMKKWLWRKGFEGQDIVEYVPNPKNGQVEKATFTRELSDASSEEMLTAS